VTRAGWTGAKVALAGLSLGLSTSVVVGAVDVPIGQWLFVNTTYYLLMATLLVWAGTYLYRGRELGRDEVTAWLKENWPGLLLATAVTVVVALAVDPALRMLSDEANLVGVSKNLFASKTATFTVSGKYYYESYWDVDVAIDQRPTLFPFLVSLVHALCGYSYRNAFALNLLLLPAFLFVAYRLAKSLGGQTFALAASLLVLAHPVVLLSIRSGGFDFCAVFFALLAVKSLLDYCRDQSPGKLASLWLELCLFAEVRYESALFIVPVVALLLLFRMLEWRTLRPYAFVYALTPVYLGPRVWQSVLRGNVPEQQPGTVTFSVGNFTRNAHEYFEPILSPFHPHSAHSAIAIALGLCGCWLWARWIVARLRAKAWRDCDFRFAVSVLAWMALQAIVVFAYVWGRAQYPSSARLVIAIDVFFSFAAAWALTVLLKRFRPFVALLLSAAVFVFALPVASQGRLMNRLTQTRESAVTWRFFEGLHEKRILVVTDRPNHFTIMNYGAMSFDAARRDPYLFTALARHLFRDVYVIQQVQLSTGRPLPGYAIWPDRKLDPVFEFQNDADVLVRVCRLVL
jgi:hypothetical protein